MDKKSFFLVRFSLEKITKIKICHMVSKEHTEMIEGWQRLIAVDVLESEEADVDASVNNYGAASDEDDVSCLVGACVKEEVKDM